jgi:hypothetical protein
VKEENSQYMRVILKLEMEKKELECPDKKGKKIFKKNMSCPY